MPRSETIARRTLFELAEAVKAKVVGDGSFVVTGVAHPDLAGGADTLALAMDETAYAALGSTRAKAAAVSEGAEIDLDRLAGGIVVERPRYALALLLDIFAQPRRHFEGIHPLAHVEAGAEIADGASIGAHASIGVEAKIGANTVVEPNATIAANAEVGENCLIRSGARIGERVKIGDNVIIHQNAVVGSDGYSFVTPEVGSVETAKTNGEIGARNLELVRIHSIGTVLIGDDVEIGAGTTIDRATLGATTIGRGTKMDNQVHIGHNCTIGENCLFAGQSGVSGSVVIGDRVVLAGKVGVADHVSIGDDAIVAAGSGVGVDIPAKTIWLGYPALPKNEKIEEYKNVARLRRLIPDVLALKRRVSDLENK